jgi:hypothetical protein
LIITNHNNRLKLYTYYDIPTSITENRTKVNKKILVYPNPAGDYIKITIDKPSEGSELEIYDVLGERVFSKSIHPMTLRHRMNIANLPSGVYFVRIGAQVEKFVKE